MGQGKLLAVKLCKKKLCNLRRGWKRIGPEEDSNPIVQTLSPVASYLTFRTHMANSKGLEWSTHVLAAHMTPFLF